MEEKIGGWEGGQKDERIGGRMQRWAGRWEDGKMGVNMEKIYVFFFKSRHGRGLFMAL